MAEEREHNAIQDDEIDLIELAKTIWSGRKFIAKVAGVFVLIGLVIAFTSPIEYETSCRLLPENQESQMKNLGGLAGLAGLAGVDIGGMSGSNGVLTPQLYPEIVNSLPFILEVMNDTVYFEHLGIKTTPRYYFKEIKKPSLLGYILSYTFGLPGTLKKNFFGETEVDSPSEFLRLSREEWKIIEKFKERIILNIDEKTGVIKITVEMPDAYASAQLAKKVELLITESVTDYITDKSKKNLEFILESYNEAKSKFENTQERFARVSDKNKNFTTATAKIELKRIEHEYDIAFGVFKGLSSQVEKAKFKLKEQTPIFTTLEPVTIPYEKSSPRRKLILVVSLGIGLFIGLCAVVIKNYMNLILSNLGKNAKS